MKFRESKEDYALNVNAIERWQDTAGYKNRKLIKRWANKRRELIEVKNRIKKRKSELAEELQERKNTGEKITDKMVDILIDSDKEMLELKEERDYLEVDIDEDYQVLLLYRDMWNSAPTLRQSLTNLERAEMTRDDY